MTANYFGFDFGLARIGVAVGQRLTATASPLATLHSRDEKPDWDGITRLLDEWRPAALVVGLPYNADGSRQPLTERAERFARQLEGRYGLPVHRVDERYSSQQAGTILRRQRREGRPRIRKTDIDAAAACIILEAWLQEHPTDADHE